MNRSAGASRAEQKSFVDELEAGVSFLNRPRIVTPSCLVLDVSLPDPNGLELRSSSLPIG